MENIPIVLDSGIDVLADKDKFITDLAAACLIVNNEEESCDYSELRELEIPSYNYYSFSAHIISVLHEVYGYSFDRPERSGLNVPSQIIAGMTMAAADFEELDVASVCVAMKDQRSTKWLRDVTAMGRVGGCWDETGGRVTLVEDLLGLRTPRYLQPIDVFSRLCKAFKFVAEPRGPSLGYFAVSDRIRDDYERIVGRELAGEGVCPMRGKVEKVFCLMAEAACANPSLVERDLRGGSFDLILP